MPSKAAPQEAPVQLPTTQLEKKIMVIKVCLMSDISLTPPSSNLSVYLSIYLSTSKQPSLTILSSSHTFLDCTTNKTPHPQASISSKRKQDIHYPENKMRRLQMERGICMRSRLGMLFFFSNSFYYFS